MFLMNSLDPGVGMYWGFGEIMWIGGAPEGGVGDGCCAEGGGGKALLDDDDAPAVDDGARPHALPIATVSWGVHGLGCCPPPDIFAQDLQGVLWLDASRLLK